LEERDASHPFWRGRLEHVGGEAPVYAQDGATVLRFIRRKLLESSGIALPLGVIRENER